MEKTPSIVYLEQVQELFLKESSIDINKLQSSISRITPKTQEKELQILKHFFNKKQLESIKNAMDIHNKKKIVLPTKYETNGSYSIIMDLSKKIENGLDLLRFQKE